MAKYKTFNSRRYERVAGGHSKREAQRIAKKFRKKESLARVVKEKSDYAVNSYSVYARRVRFLS